MASIKFRGLQKISAETIGMLDPVFLLRSVGCLDQTGRLPSVVQRRRVGRPERAVRLIICTSVYVVYVS